MEKTLYVATEIKDNKIFVVLKKRISSIQMRVLELYEHLSW